MLSLCFFCRKITEQLLFNITSQLSANVRVIHPEHVTSLVSARFEFYSTFYRQTMNMIGSLIQFENDLINQTFIVVWFPHACSVIFSYLSSDGLYCPHPQRLYHGDAIITPSSWCLCEFSLHKLYMKNPKFLTDSTCELLLQLFKKISVFI